MKITLDRQDSELLIQVLQNNLDEDRVKPLFKRIKLQYDKSYPPKEAFQAKSDKVSYVDYDHSKNPKFMNNQKNADNR